MLQDFHWYLPNDGAHWRSLKTRVKELAQAGFTALWLPPSYKGMNGINDVGYGVYDLYDLGEFDQKGSIATKYGTRAEYLAALRAAQGAGLQVYADAVFNHRMGGDSVEEPNAIPFSQDNRLTPKGPLERIQAYTHYTFPGRHGRHSTFEWHWWHFDALDWNGFRPDDRGTIYLLEGKKFDNHVALEKGNFAYIMGCDLDFEHPEVQEEIMRWGKWYLDSTGVDGFRLDAIKHISAWFFPAWLDEMEKHAGRDLFIVGEYWAPHLGSLEWYLDAVGGRMAVFDVPLHYNFYYAGESGSHYDLRSIFNGTLVSTRPSQAVTFVDNHDSQPLQALESAVAPWFKPLAYALTLLRSAGYPCVFYPDYYGAAYRDWGRDGQQHEIVMPSHRLILDKLLDARQRLAYGPQYDYFDDPNVIGWTRLGDATHREALAVLMSNAGPGAKWMEVGRANTRFTDLTGNVPQPTITNDTGWGEFHCAGGSVSIWAGE